MIKKLYNSLFFLSLFMHLSYSAFSQAPTFDWAKRMGDGNYHYGYDITTDNADNVYVTGYFQGTVDFDPNAGVNNLTSNGGYDVFIQKLDPDGNLLWVKQIGGTSSDYGYSIITDDANNVFVTGRFGNTVDFDPGAGTNNLVSAGANEIFVLKLDVNGDFVWAKHMGGNGSDYGRGVTIDDNGNVYTTGYFEGTADFDPTAGTTNLTSSGNDDVFIHKMDNDGNFIWAKQFGSTSADRGYGLCYDNGNIYTTGIFLNVVDFDPSGGTSNLTSNGGADIFIQKIDTSGNFIWAKHMGSTGNDYGFSITTDGNNNVISTGYFVGTSDFETGSGVTSLSSFGNTDAFIQKLDESGNLLWAKQIGGTSAEVGNKVKTDLSGNIYTIGFFNSTPDFDPNAGVVNISSLGGTDAYIHKMDSNGNYVWVQLFGGPGYNEGRSVALDNNGGIYTTGHFQQTVDFDQTAGIFNLTSAGNNDIFIHKMSQCIPSQGTDQLLACNSYTWIDGNTYNSSNNTATYTIIGGAASGCDSIVTLDLSILYSNTGVENVTACDTYTWAANGSTYTSTTTDVANLTNVDGCDSTVTLNLIINNSNTGSETISACDSYTWAANSITYTSSTSETVVLTNLSGCDSTVTLDLTIYNSFSNTEDETACDSFTWPVNGITYANSATIVETFTTINGCDSIHTLNLTINSIDNGITQSGASLFADEAGATYQWLICPSMVIIDGATNQEYIPTSNGEYAVIISQDGCIDTSACFSILDVGFLENSFEKEIIIYPNPTSGILSIDFGQNYKELNITLSTLDGKIIKEEVYSDCQTINMEIDEASGIYLLKIESNNKNAIIRIVKE